MSKQRQAQVLYGVCFFHSETGTEGGYWAFQDRKFMGLRNDKDFVCSKCGDWMKKEYAKRRGRKGLTDFDGRKKCKNGDRHAPEAAFPQGMWSYDGLHILKDEDRLTIYSKESPTKVVWSGIIKLRQYPLFSESVSNMWIHADQKGISRKKWAKWFLEEHPAKLILAESEKNKKTKNDS